MGVCGCVWVREMGNEKIEKERGRERESVCERERGRERERENDDLHTNRSMKCGLKQSQGQSRHGLLFYSDLTDL